MENQHLVHRHTIDVLDAIYGRHAVRNYLPRRLMKILSINYSKLLIMPQQRYMRILEPLRSSRVVAA